MTAYDDLLTLIIDATSELNKLKGILDDLDEQVESLSLVPGGTNQDVLLKAYDALGSFWRVKQTTANDGIEYFGIFKLPVSSITSRIKEVVVINHSNPAAPNAPARVLPAGADPVTGWIDLTSVNDLLNKDFNAFLIRSASAFEVKIRLTTLWCYTFNFVPSGAGAQGWILYPPGPVGTLTNGIGWEDTVNTSTAYRGIQIQRAFTDTQITSVSFVYDLTHGSMTDVNGAPTGIRLYNGSSVVYTDLIKPAPAGSNLTYSRNVNQWANKMDVYLVCGNNGGSGDPGGSATLKSITIRGSGANPFGASNCAV